eukprot:216552-Pelagomonas_calceolata.AAC.1
MKAGLKPATTSTAARTDIECACCQICNYRGGYEPINFEPPYPDMYICDVCQRTYRWKCMKELGCYTDGQGQGIDAADTWTCPTCAGLNNTQKIERECQSREELIRVTWMPSWEPEETNENWPEFQQRLLEFEIRRSKPDLSRPTADSALSNLESQGFEKPDAINTWKQKLGTELHKIIFDMNPINPQVDIKTTGCCEFRLHVIELVNYKAKQSPNQGTESHSPPSQTPPPLILPEINKSHMACICNTQGKCVGIIYPIRFQIRYRAFYKAKLAGLHEAITPTPTSYRGTSILWRSNTVKTPGPRTSLRPPSNSTATYVAIFQGPQL